MGRISLDQDVFAESLEREIISDSDWGQSLDQVVLQPLNR
jgi:hypothetical protein